MLEERIEELDDFTCRLERRVKMAKWRRGLTLAGLLRPAHKRDKTRYRRILELASKNLDFIESRLRLVREKLGKAQEACVRADIARARSWVEADNLVYRGEDALRDGWAIVEDLKQALDLRKRYKRRLKKLQA